MNPYLAKLREKYTAYQTSIEGLQTRAADENRDLTDDELRSVKDQGDAAKVLFTQIEDLTDIENRNRKVAELAVAVAGNDGDVQNRSGAYSFGNGDGRQALGIQTQDRDPGHYTRNSKHSFFRDLVQSRESGDQGAMQRLGEHHRALSSADQGTGIVPPKYLADEYQEMAKQGRALANAVRTVPLGDDPRPFTIGRQTGSADVEEQVSENDSVLDSDGYDSTVDTVTPKPTSGAQNVSRQFLDTSGPMGDSIIFQDLITSYNQKYEAKVAAAVMGTGTALQADLTPTDLEDPEHYNNVAIDALVAVRKARGGLPATLFAMSTDRYGELLKLKDSTGRPLVPADSGGAMNVVGVGTVAVDGRWHGVGIVATEGVLTANEFAAIRTPDVLGFESNMLQFRYEQPQGPQTVKLGVWAYTAVFVKFGTAPVKVVELTELA